MSDSCMNCKHLKRLIMWCYNNKGRYLPNYDRPLQCCTALADEKDGTVYGHTEPVSENNLCEMWEEQEHE